MCSFLVSGVSVALFSLVFGCVHEAHVCVCVCVYVCVCVCVHQYVDSIWSRWQM